MKRTGLMFLLAVVAAIALLASGAAGAQPPGDPTAQQYPNPSSDDIVEWLPQAPPDHRIQYGNGPLEFGDLRLPDRQTPGGHPVAVFVHGGAWTSQWNMDYSDRLVEALTSTGVATWNIEYRRPGHAGGDWPGVFLDVAHGLDYLRELADEHSLDLSRVVVAGHSAGGHLAFWLAARDQLPEDSELFMPDPLPVSGVVSLDGVLDLEADMDVREAQILALLGVETRQEATERLDVTSPILLVPLGVPQAVIASSQSVTLNQQAVEYTQAARAAGDDVEYTLLEGANHFDQVDPCGPAWPTVAGAVLSLLDLDPPSGEVKSLGGRLCPPDNSR